MSRSMLNHNLLRHWQRSPLARRWQALSGRDQLALLGLGAFLLLVLLYLMLWQPAQRYAQSSRAAFETQRALHSYLQSHAPQLRGRDLSLPDSLDPARLQGQVTATAAQLGLVIDRLDAEGYGVVQVSLQPVAFDSLLRWIEQLEEQGVRVDSLVLDRGEDNRVQARLGLRAGQ